MRPSLTVPLEIKSVSNKREFEGYGSTFGNVDLGGDVVVKGAFRKTLAEHQQSGTLPAMLWMHQMDRVPGKWLEMREDDDGLYVKGVYAPTPLGDEIYELTKMGALGGLSIGYSTEQAAFDRQGRRLLKELNLYEVSPVTLPMNPAAKIEYVKSRVSAAGEYVPSRKELEEILRNAGFTRKAARDVAYIARKLDDEDEADEMPVEAPRNADDDAARAMKALADKILADVIRQKLSV